MTERLGAALPALTMFWFSVAAAPPLQGLEDGRLSGLGEVSEQSAHQTIRRRVFDAQEACSSDPFL